MNVAMAIVGVRCALYVSATAASIVFIVFFFNDTATTEIYTLSLHDALPISLGSPKLISIHKLINIV